MYRRTSLALAGGMLFLGLPIAHPQETPAQADALAQLAKIDGKVKFDPAHPKRVISIDL